MTNIIVASQEACDTFDGPILHACVFPCWRSVTEDWPEAHKPSTIDTGYDLYLNIADTIDPFYQKLYIWKAALRFLDRFTDEPVLVHCNAGISRSPSIALTAQARAGELPATTYLAARKAYSKKNINAYWPGMGMQGFLTANWKELMAYNGR